MSNHSTYVLSYLAQRDINNIWDYTKSNWSEEQADTYTFNIQKTLQTIAKNPTIGRDCHRVRAGYRKHPTESHMVFYRVVDGGIDVIRILHQSMSTEHHLL